MADKKKADIANEITDAIGAGGKGKKVRSSAFADKGPGAEESKAMVSGGSADPNGAASPNIVDVSKSRGERMIPASNPELNQHSSDDKRARAERSPPPRQDMRDSLQPLTREGTPPGTLRQHRGPPSRELPKRLASTDAAIAFNPSGTGKSSGPYHEGVGIGFLEEMK